MDSLASVFGSVKRRSIVRIAPSDVYDERIAGDLVPCDAQLVLAHVAAFRDRVQMYVPAVVAAATLDFDEGYSALLGFAPESTPTELSEAVVKPADVLGE